MIEERYNFMANVKEEIELIKNYINHHRLILYGMLVLLVILSISVVITLKLVLPSSISNTTPKAANMILPTLATAPASTAKIEPAVPLKQDYQNPFDAKTQYVNPFTQNKNPFDTLK